MQIELTREKLEIIENSLSDLIQYNSLNRLPFRYPEKTIEKMIDSRIQILDTLYPKSKEN